MTQQNPPGRWLKRLLHVPESGRQIICFPHAGGAASFFHAWAAHLPAEVGLSAVQYPGREDRLADDLICDMNELVDQATAAVLPVCGEETVLFGHSMGAVVAYEVALKAREAGRQLRRLVVSAHPPPHRHQAKVPPVTEAEILEELRISSGGLPLSVDIETFREIFLPSLRNDYGIVCGFTRREAMIIDIPVIALVGRTDPKVTPQQMEAWAEVAPPGSFTAKRFEGGHFYLRDNTNEIVSLASG